MHMHMLCYVTFLPAMKMPPSPTFQQQSALVSDPSSSLLQSNTTTTTPPPPRIISPTSSSSSCSRHGTRSRPNLSSKIVRRPKHGSSKSSRGGCSFSSSSMYDHINHLQDSSSSSNSPYYKGLLDQSLAIFDEIGSSCTPLARPDAPTPPPHPPQACYPIPMITSLNLNLHLSSGHSPYYKGLTDYSLVIGTSCWSPAAAPLPIHDDDDDDQSTNPLSCHQSSPYYQGLIDYSLVLHGPHHLPPHPHSTNSQHSSASASALAPAPATTGPDIVENLTPPTCTSSPLASTLNDLITTTMGDDDDDNNGSLTEEKKPLRDETVVSKEVVYDKSILEEKMEMELGTKGAGEDDGAGLVIEEAIKVESTVLAAAAEEEEENMNADKTSCLKEMTKEDSVESVIEEKPLRERVSDSDSEALVVKEDGNADKSTLKDQMELDIIQGKPLRERVSDSEIETTRRSLKEKPLLVSGQRVVVVASREDTAEVYQYTWAAKHQPMTLDDFICNRDIALQLKALVREGCGCNHFIFEGPPNVGKRSMIRAMLREVFGADRVQVIKECKDFNLKGEMVEKLQVQIKKSEHHVEVNLSETKGYEKHVIVELFKETYGKIINNSLPCSPQNCQAIILYEAEKLSIESMLYIKWLLDKYKWCCNKVFFCCSDESKLHPLKPLCTTVRLSPPSPQQILKILEYIGEQEGIQLSHNLVKKIILRSRNNLRQAIRSLEATCRNKDALKDDDLILTGWEYDILNIAKLILQEQTPKQLYLIRRKLQSLMVHDVPPAFVHKSLVAELTTLVDASLRSGVAKLDKEYNRASEVEFETVKQMGAQNKQKESDERNNEPTKWNASSYFKIEEFIAKFMSWYKNYILFDRKQVIRTY